MFDYGWSWTLQYGSSPGVGLETPLKDICWYRILLQNSKLTWSFGQFGQKLWAEMYFFEIFLTSRWRCSETTHVPSGHACYNTYHVCSESAKMLRRYSLMSIFARISSNSFTCFTKTVWYIKKLQNSKLRKILTRRNFNFSMHSIRIRVKKQFCF